MNKLINISEAAKVLNLIDPKTRKPLNHVLRYWEKEFKEIKPRKINNRRYYSEKQLEIIKKIKYLLKSKGMTILGVKNSLKFETKKLDVHEKDGLKAEYYKENLKSKSKSILKKINKLKYGKKNSS